MQLPYELLLQSHDIFFNKAFFHGDPFEPAAHLQDIILHAWISTSTWDGSPWVLPLTTLRSSWALRSLVSNDTPTGWWVLTILKNMKVSWGYTIPNIWKNKKLSKPPTKPGLFVLPTANSWYLKCEMRRSLWHVKPAIWLGEPLLHPHCTTFTPEDTEDGVGQCGKGATLWESSTASDFLGLEYIIQKYLETIMMAFPLPVWLTRGYVANRPAARKVVWHRLINYKIITYWAIYISSIIMEK
jgi:hypothetical protein